MEAELRKFGDVLGNRLTLVGPTVDRRTFEFRAEGDIVGLLRIGGWRQPTTAESLDGRWAFRSTWNLFRRRVVIHDIETGVDVAIYRQSVIELADGRRFQVSKYLADQDLDLTSEYGDELLKLTTSRFEEDWGKFRTEAGIDVLKPIIEMPEMPWMIMFGGFLIWNMWAMKIARTPV